MVSELNKDLFHIWNIKGQNIKDIRKDSFEEYANFQLDKRHKGKWKNLTKGLAPSTINADISTLNVIFNWMVEEEHLQLPSTNR